MDDVREMLAAALWKEEGRSGTTSIYERRTPEAFANQSDETRTRWFRFADAALAALIPASDGRAEGLKEAVDCLTDLARVSNLSFEACKQLDEIARILAALTPARAADVPAWTPPEAERADGFDTLIADAKAEAAKAMRKFPQPNYVISKVAEEAGEVVKAAIHCAEGREDIAELRGEMKQLIAMLYRLWVEGDEVHGLPPVGPIPPAPAQEGEG